MRRLSEQMAKGTDLWLAMSSDTEYIVFIRVGIRVKQLEDTAIINN